MIIKILKIFGLCLFGIFVLFMIGITIYGLVEGEREDDYCERVYPSKISEQSVSGNSWSETSRVKSGYVRCCRYYWEEYEKKDECQIFPHIK